MTLSHTATASNVQIVPPEPAVEGRGLTVTPDGSFVDFNRDLTLWRVPFLGRTPKRVFDNIRTPVLSKNTIDAKTGAVWQGSGLLDRAPDSDYHDL